MSATTPLPHLSAQIGDLVALMGPQWNAHPALSLGMSYDAHDHTPILSLIFAHTDSTPAEGAAWFTQLADLLNTSAPTANHTGTARLVVDDYNATGVRVIAAANTAEPVEEDV